MSEVKNKYIPIQDKKAWSKKVDGARATYKLKDKNEFMKDSPVAIEDIKKLDKYSKEYVETALKTTTVFAADAFKEDEDLDYISYKIPYRDDSAELVYLKDKDEYTAFITYEVKHMSHTEELKARNKALNKALAEED